MSRQNKKSKSEEEVLYTCVAPPKQNVSKIIDSIQKQYDKRIEYVKNSNKSKQEKKEEIKQLQHNASLDPRRPNIFYNTKDMAQKKWRIARRLSSLSDAEFLTASYVLTWATDRPDVWVGYYQGKMANLYVDAIVDFTNNTLPGRSGADNAIHNAEKSKLSDEGKKILRNKYKEELPTGKTVLTTNKALPAKYVIHIGGPVWKGGSQKRTEALYGCYYNSLKTAKDNGLKVIAFSKIGTDTLDYPEEKAQRVFIKALADFTKKYPNTIEEILLMSSQV